MEFVNTNFKKAKSGKNRGGKYENGESNGNGRSHPQNQQFEQKASVLTGGGYGQISNTNNGLLKALQQTPSKVAPQPLMNSGSALGNLFCQNVGIKKNQGKKMNNGGGDSAGGQIHNAVNKINTNHVQESHEDMTKRLNNETLIRVDSSFKGLFGTASQVAVYDYDGVTKDWVDTKMCGPFFLYDRADVPEYGLVVLNRKGMRNLIMFFDKQSQIIPHEPYLLFRRGPDEVIKCIWFYKDSEFHEALILFRKMGVQFDQCDDKNAANTNSNSSAHIATTNNSSTSLTMGGAPAPNLFDMLKQSQAKIDGSLPKLGTKAKVFTAEELEQKMLQDNSATDRLGGPRSGGALNNIGLGGLGTQGGGGASLLQQLTTSAPVAVSETLPAGKRGPKKISGDSDDSLPAQLKDASRSMRTVEQLEKALMPEDSTKCEMSNELLATLGIKPLKSLLESSSETPQSPFMTPTSRSISESERSQKKLTIDDLDGKLYEETDEDMVREVVENLADLTELLLLSENVPGHSEPQLVWRKRSNLQNRPPSALVQVPRANGVGSNTPNMHQKHSVMNNASTSSPAISPLTENQLLQAITYLLQTDPSFIGKIHDAYVKSLQQTWASRLG